MKTTNLYGFYLKPPTERIYQTIKVGKHYEQGTLFYVDPDSKHGSLNSVDVPAFTMDDSDYEAGVSKYVGCVAAVEGLTASSGGKITLCADAEIDEQLVEALKSANDSDFWLDQDALYLGEIGHSFRRIII